MNISASFKSGFVLKLLRAKDIAWSFQKGWVFIIKVKIWELVLKRGWNRLAAKTVLILRILLCRLRIFRQGDGRRSGGGGGIKGIVRGGVALLLHNSIEFQLSAHLVVCPLAHANSILIGANLCRRFLPATPSSIALITHWAHKEKLSGQSSCRSWRLSPLIGTCAGAVRAMHCGACSSNRTSNINSIRKGLLQ